MLFTMALIAKIEESAVFGFLMLKFIA